MHSRDTLTLFQGFVSHLGICADSIHILKTILHPLPVFRFKVFSYGRLCGILFSHSVMCDSFATPWTVAHQAPLSMGFFRQEYWSGLPRPAPGDLPNPDIESVSPTLAGGFFTAGPSWKPVIF